MAPVKKMGEVFVLQPVLNKNLFQFFKIHLRFPRNAFGKRLVKNVAKAVFWGKVVILDPPEVVSGFRGGGVHWLVELPCVQEWF
jgi:hypothetical protein